MWLFFFYGENMSQIYEYTMAELVPNIERCIKAAIPAILHGSPGIGKSAVLAEIAKKFKLKVIDIRLSTFTPEELNGYLVPNIEEQRADYIAPSIFPIQGKDKVPEGYDGWLLLLDELPQALPAIQKAAFKLILDRMVGEFKLHNNVRTVAAGNKVSDGAMATKMNTALQSRMVHFVVKSDPKSWIEYAANAAIDHRVVSFIRYREDALNNFKPDHSDLTYACERTWGTFVSDLIKNEAEVTLEKDLIVLSGAVGSGPALEFIGFCECYKDLPTMPEILKDPENAKLPKEPSSMFALTGTLANNINESNIAVIMDYILRMGVEFQIITLRPVIAKFPHFAVENNTVKAWAIKNISNLR